MANLNLGSWKFLVAVPALVLLTGAKGQGCGGEVPEEPPTPIVECPAGSHLESTCDDDGVIYDDSDYADADRPTTPGSTPQCMHEPCEQVCVPDDNFCPPGAIEETICAAAVMDCAPGAFCPPPEEECWTECVQYCPDGGVAEWVCTDEPQPLPPPQFEGDDAGAPEFAPGEPTCFLACPPIEPTPVPEPGPEPAPVPEPAPAR